MLCAILPQPNHSLVVLHQIAVPATRSGRATGWILRVVVVGAKQLALVEVRGGGLRCFIIVVSMGSIVTEFRLDLCQLAWVEWHQQNVAV